MKVSVIIPVYNGENELARSLQSILDQTEKDIEVIVVDDGSTDNTAIICKEYADLDQRVKLITQEHGGVGRARNTGIRLAQGDYIGFVDADDQIAPRMYECMYKKASLYEADICVCNYIKQTGEKQQIVPLGVEEDYIEQEDILQKLLLPIIAGEHIGASIKLGGYRGSCMYLYRKKFIQDKQYYFLEDMPIGEDFIFNLYCLANVKRVAIVQEALYYYTTNFKSATKRYRKDSLQNHHRIIKEVEKFITGNSELRGVSKRLDYLKFSYAGISIINECHLDNTQTVLQKLNNIAQICNDPVIKVIFKNTSWKEAKGARKPWVWAVQYKITPLLYISATLLLKRIYN